jgi:hypothetical protein
VRNAIASRYTRVLLLAGRQPYAYRKGGNLAMNDFLGVSRDQIVTSSLLQFDHVHSQALFTLLPGRVGQPPTFAEDWVVWRGLHLWP